MFMTINLNLTLLQTVTNTHINMTHVAIFKPPPHSTPPMYPPPPTTNNNSIAVAAGATMGACATKPKTLEGKVPEEVSYPTSTPKVAPDTTVSNEVADTLINHFFFIVDLISNT
jgi:hypothetical protein